MSLQSRAIKGVGWTSISTVIIIGLQLLQLVILGRILDATAFGLMGMIMVITGFAEKFVDMGISNSIIHSKNITTNELSSLYWFNILLGVCISILIWLVTPLIILLFKEQDLEKYIHWISFMFLITPLGQQYRALLLKNFMFNLSAIIETLSYLIGILFSIMLAVSGKGVDSLVLGLVVTTLVRTILLFFFGKRLYRPKLHLVFSEISRFLSFGLYQTGESTINYFNTKIDTLIIGRFLGATALGIYTLPFNIIILPSAKINPIINKVAFPIFSSIQDEQDRIKKGFFKVLTIVNIINFPIFFGLYLISPIFITVVFGEKWEPSIEILQILCGVGLLRSIGNPVGSLMMATGNVDLSFKFNAMKLITQLPGILIGAMLWGINGVASIYLFLQFIYIIFSYLYLLKNALGPCLIDYLRTFLPALFPAMIMGAAILVSNYFIHGVNDFISLILKITIGVVIYGICLLFSRDRVVVDFKKIINVKFNVNIL
ncbi:MOP flippase family protein [Halobacillus rhizosphaerae]|uniref:MOP flippase family protein n=1 Tax=Halobacillus rhizosphaerae TaxID=3064889 RepID=UPI00398ADF16